MCRDNAKQIAGTPPWTWVLVALCCGVALARSALVHLRVAGQSMAPTLVHDQRLWVNRWAYGIWSWTRSTTASAPRRGDIVVFRPQDESSQRVIKRVVAVPGEVLEVDRHRVLLDGDCLEEPYLPPDTVTTPPMRLSVAPDCFFVMGDHRECSHDSRDYGPVPRSRIIGRAFLRYWPIEQAEWLGHRPRGNRLEKIGPRR